MNYINGDPVFYLVSGERSEPTIPTACRYLGRLRDSRRDDYMLVAIDPVIHGAKYGMGQQDIDQLVLSTRLVGASLLRQWPCFVYVMRVVENSILTSLTIREDDVQMISWGSLHQSEEDAARVAAMSG